MSDRKEPKIIPPGMIDAARRTIPSSLLGDSMTWTKYSRETNGEYTEFHCIIQPGYSNPAHYHTRFTETLTVKSGTLTIGLNGKEIKLTSGDSPATVEVGDVHSLDNKSGSPVEFVCRLCPGDEGFERAMYIMHGIANDGGSTGDGVPYSPVVMSMLIEMMDARLVGLVWWLASLLLAVLRRGGKGMGVEDRLVGKYWKFE